MASKRAVKANLSAQVLDWLLEEADPSVRLFALTKLLGEDPEGKDARKARSALMKSGPAAAILERQGSEGCWGEGPDFYTDKYKGTVWQLLVLAELGADGADRRIASACEYLFAHSQEPESGGFSIEASAKLGGRRGEVIPCLTGNLAWALGILGYLDDPRLVAARDWICRYQRADDNVASPPSGWPYDGREPCFGRHSCFMGVVKAMKALASVPPASRRKEEEDKARELAEFMLSHNVFKRSGDLSKVSKPGWLKFGFPLMYQTDVLEILCVLRGLGVRDERMGEALAAVEALRGPDGRWKLANSFNGKTLVDIERKGEDSKWITARALYALGAP